MGGARGAWGGVVRDLLGLVLGLAEQIAEGLGWWRDWQRTWSPVSFWLAVFVFAGLALVVLMTVVGR